ncbi:MAG: tetratricopeptide repeat protein [Acidobacteriota bacterium]|nr:tetratricopeptide repeat protein [Acidobacteriota bacterium]
MRYLAVATLLAAALPAFGADRWMRLTTSNFELYTSGDEKAARDTILYFEQVRGFFVKAAPVPFPGEFPVRIIVFKNREEFSKYSANPIEIAYYAAGEKRDYIVMADPSHESYAIAVHEYMHLIIRHSGLHIPVWLNEGLADVYSSLRPVRDGVAVGDLIPGRVQALTTGRWLTFDSLTSASKRSSVYNEAERAGVFYAESWALTHMLFLSPEYRDNFGKFVVALHRGRSSAEACEIAFGRSSAQVFQDLEKYMAGRKFYGRVFQTKLPKAQAQAETSTLSDWDSRLMLADLLAATGRADRARTEYQQLEREQPGQPEVMQSLGYFALAAKDFPLAREYFEKAFAAGESDPQMCLRLAMLEREADQPADKILPALERAIHSRPDYADALVQLGLMRIKLHDFPAAINVLMSIENVTPEQASPLFSGLAYAYLQTGDLANARKNVETARKWAKGQDEIGGVDRLSAFIEARSAGPLAPKPGEKLAQAEGILQTLDCTVVPHRLHVMTGDKSISLLLPDANAVEFTQPGGGSVQIACGAQPPRHIHVVYGLGGLEDRFAAGVVRTIEFGP